MSTAIQPLVVPRSGALTLARDYAELAKLRVTSLIIMTAWCGYYFGALKSGDLRCVERDIEAVVGPCRTSNTLSKVIIEAALLTDDEKVTACTLAKAAGADFVKTSTGFGPGGATVADVALMRRVVGPEMGVKAAGGVRDLAGLQAMVAAGATRVGASAGVKIVREVTTGKSEPATAGKGY